MKRLTVGILAHVDSGKTTLSEALLYKSGNIRKLGRVDHADTFLDTYSLERERGITIFSKQAMLTGDDCEISLIDTPGHVDFSPEAERTLSVLDAAILVISGTEGVQSHTETLWQLLSRHEIPTLIFVNKMDVPSADKETLLIGMKKKLSDFCMPAELLENHEEAAGCSEELMDKYLSGGRIDDSDISSLVGERRVFPCFFGSALKTDGVGEFLSWLMKYVPEPPRREDFGAKIYKISHDENGARLAHMKITGGTLSLRDTLSGVSRDGAEWSEKVNSLRLYSGGGFSSVGCAYAGQVVTVGGLSHVLAGDTLGFEEEIPDPVLEPFFNFRVVLPENSDVFLCYSKIKSLEEEEPQLRVSYEEELAEIRLLLMGQVQLEIIKHMIKERFALDVSFDKGSVVYRETISDTVEGVGHYEPLRHYAEVHLLLEPLERGSGLIFDTDCPTDELERSWQRLILTHLEEKTHKGVLTGSPITDMKITLVAGRAHKKHTEGGDFRKATYRAVRHGLRRAESILLEPWYSFEIRVPDGFVGRAMTDVSALGGKPGIPESDGEYSVLRGTAPVSKIGMYGMTLNSYSHGLGSISFSFSGYEVCPDAQQIIEQIGYDPDADIRNSCDSVFCSGGAGFLVKWDEVEKYMHIESVLSGSREREEERRELKRLAENYIARAASDDELMAIFERTYGPVRRRESAERIRSSVPSPKEPKPHKPKVSYDGEEYLLVDGYNIIFAWEELKSAARSSLDLARSTLINRLCNYQGFCGTNIILVFDAYKVKKNPGTVESFRNISVVYTKEAETADAYIEKVSHELSKKHRVRVATSDGSEQMIILGNGALRVPAAAFHKELKDAEKAIRDIIE